MSKKSPSIDVALWLFICCGMIFFMAVIGAVTRLTGSGLSMTSWDPIMGALPPLNDHAWQEAFAHYQEIPQYKIYNHGMTLEAFKEIYFWEWFHRLWGRLIALVFALPLIIFAFQRKLARATILKFIVIFLLGALQGFIGWFMVQSGLEILTSVSPYRLALHLSFALMIYSLLFWAAFDEFEQSKAQDKIFKKPIDCHGICALLFLSVTIVWGAFTAGLHAGEVYNTWPLMDGTFIPDTASALQPLWHNYFENPALVQWIHRWLGPSTMIIILTYVLRYLSAGLAGVKRSLTALGVMALLQPTLGILTVLSHAALGIAVIHQAGAMILLSLLLYNLRKIQMANLD